MKRIITNKIVVHHAVMPQNMGQEEATRRILSAHKAAGLASDGYIAYHRVIGDNWVAPGRPETLVGYHSGKWTTNLSSIAVCLMGNFNNDQPTQYQKDKLKETLQEWMKRYNLNQGNIALHRQITATACPGRNIDMPLIYSLLAIPDKITDDQIKAFFKECWNGIAPATGDWMVFKKEYERNILTSIGAMKNEMKSWYETVYPKGVYSKAGNDKWQRKKNKFLVS